MANQLIVSRLTTDQCQEREDKINAHAENIRLLLVELHEGEAWTVRGFTTWREYAVAKFDHSESHLYRLLNAGLIERRLDSPIGENAESQLRELMPLDSNPDLQKAVWDIVQAQPKVTAQIVKQAVNAALDFANEFIVSKGHTSLEGDGLEVAKAAITERMLEAHNRQLQHIADNMAKKWNRPVLNQPLTVVRASPTTGIVVLKFAPEVAEQFASLIDAEGLRATIQQMIPPESKG